MRYKSRKIWLPLVLVVLLTSCSKSLINYQPMDKVDELCFDFSGSVPDDVSTINLFYSIDNKSYFEEITEKYNLSKYCSTLEMFDNTFFSNYIMFMFFHLTSGNHLIGSEINDNLIIYHTYYTEALDAVLISFCFTTVIEKASLSSYYDNFEYTITSQMVSYDDFDTLENNENLFYV